MSNKANSPANESASVHFTCRIPTALKIAMIEQAEMQDRSLSNMASVLMKKGLESFAQVDNTPDSDANKQNHAAA